MAQLGFARQITRSTKSTKMFCGRLSLLVIVMLLVFLVFSVPTLAWGSITHTAICRDAGGGAAFAMGGAAPDMIALHSVTTGDHSFDYAHNCYGDSSEPVFGDMVAGISATDSAAGWRAHQLADSIVHASGGYSTSKTLLRNLPGKYGTDINHGAVELAVDAIILDEYYRGDVDLYVPEESEVIHDTSVAFFNSALNSSRAIPRGNIINCKTAQNLTFNWENCLQTNKFLASMLLEEPWFPEARRSLADYRGPYDRSVALINGYSSRADEETGGLQILVEGLLPTEAAMAAQPEAADENDNDYYDILNTVSKRAREIGGGKATKESTSLAIEELSKDRSIPADQQAWAGALAEMTDNRNTGLTELEKSISGRLARGRDGSAKGAAGGRRISLLPYLPCSASGFLIIVIVIWLLRRRGR